MVQRVTAPNSGPMTFRGTNTYLLGDKHLAIVDPGPDNDDHLCAVIDAIAGREVTYILVTHTHIDHTALIPRLQAETGATIMGCAPHHSARALGLGETNHLDASNDQGYAPDTVMSDGDIVWIDQLPIQAIATPGHTANHLCFTVGNDGTVLTGDHIMAWATTVVAPPDGAMRDYMASLARMNARNDRLYLPGHGGPVTNPQAFTRALIAHRKMRERAIIECVSNGQHTIEHIVSVIYRDTDPRLHGAAALSVLAHLEDLVARGVVASDGRLGLDGHYEIPGAINLTSS